MRRSRHIPAINAGSMADIAFLLLLFFLVSTTISQEKGITRKLPRPCPVGQDCNELINERNVLRINMNETGQLMVDNESADYSELLGLLKNFLDNNGDASCDYCGGSKLVSSSDNPQEAVISISTNREAPYEYFIAVQDEITQAFLELRQVYVSKMFQKELIELTAEELQQVQAAYPFHISEATLQ